MTILIVHLLEEIDINHHEDQIPMIKLANVSPVRTLVVSQHLSGFGCKDLFEVTAVPHSSQGVSKGNFLEFKILTLEFQAMPAQGMLLVLQFVFQSAGLLQIVARSSQQAEEFLIEQMLLQKNQRSHDDHDGHGQEQTVGADTGWRISAKLCPGHHQRRKEYGQHGQTGLPYPMAVRGNFFHRMQTRDLARHKSDCRKPSHGGDQRNIIKTPCVVGMVVDGFTGSDRAYAIEKCGAEELRIQDPPGSLASTPDQK